MNAELKKELDKAVEGLKHDSDGLLETDELLRDEILSIKIDYLAELMVALGRLVMGIHSRDPRKAVKKHYDENSTYHDKAMRMMIRSIKEYKERKCEK